MSKELDSTIEFCQKRMEFLNTQRELQVCDVALNDSLWWQAYNRFSAALAAKSEQRYMHWTTSGDFSHLQSTPAVHF
ncbi:MAG: hypothetical protein [Bacteriophage sp.]|nr:MAG: hypothetical protein [Bacteriophage sp.]